MRAALSFASTRFIDARRAEIDKSSPFFILPTLAPRENSSPAKGGSHPSNEGCGSNPRSGRSRRLITVGVSHETYRPGACRLGRPGACCQTLDSQIAATSERLSAGCADLQTAAFAVDLLAPEKLRGAAEQGRVVLAEFCAKPPRTATDLAIAIGETMKALQAIDVARRGGAILDNTETHMNWDSAQQLLRILLQIGAGALISKGILTEEMAAIATGAVLSLAGVAWWAYWNRKRAA